MNDTHLKYDIEIKCHSYDSSDKILTVDTLVNITFVNVDIDNTNEEWVKNLKLGETCLINVYINKYILDVNKQTNIDIGSEQIIKLSEYIKKNNIIINTLTIYNKKNYTTYIDDEVFKDINIRKLYLISTKKEDEFYNFYIGYKTFYNCNLQNINLNTKNITMKLNPTYVDSTAFDNNNIILYDFDKTILNYAIQF